MNLMNDLNAFFHEKFARRVREPKTLRQRQKRFVGWLWLTLLVWFLASAFVVTGLTVEVSLWFLLLIPVSLAGTWFLASFASWYERKYL